MLPRHSLPLPCPVSPLCLHAQSLTATTTAFLPSRPCPHAARHPVDLKSAPAAPAASQTTASTFARVPRPQRRRRSRCHRLSRRRTRCRGLSHRRTRCRARARSTLRRRASRPAGSRRRPCPPPSTTRAWTSRTATSAPGAVPHDTRDTPTLPFAHDAVVPAHGFYSGRARAGPSKETPGADHRHAAAAAAAAAAAGRSCDPVSPSCRGSGQDETCQNGKCLPDPALTQPKDTTGIPEPEEVGLYHPKKMLCPCSFGLATQNKELTKIKHSVSCNFQVLIDCLSTHPARSIRESRAQDAKRCV